MIDTSTGNAIYRLKDATHFLTGKYTVNSCSELIYIDEIQYDNIRKLSADMKTTTVLIYRKDHEWKPICVYCSPSSGDLLVGMSRYDTYTNMFIGYDTGMFMGKVMRYNDSCRLTQTIPQSYTPDKLY